MKPSFTDSRRRELAFRAHRSLSRALVAIGVLSFGAACTAWNANFNRWDGVQPARRMSIWSDPQNTESWPHVPSRFGQLIFVD